MPDENPVRLYVVTVSVEYVFASRETDRQKVDDEFNELFRSNHLLRDEIEDQPDTAVSPFTYLPGLYEMNSIPWGDVNKDDTTIEQYIAQGAAPQYEKLMSEMRAARERVKAAPPKDET